MTTQTSPDGQTQTQTQDPTGPDGEPIRNMEDVRRVLQETTELRQETKGMRAILEALTEKLSAIQPAAPAGQQQAPAPSPLEEQVAALTKQLSALTQKDTRAVLSERRRTITEGVASQAGQEHREMVRGLVASMALDGDVDLGSENTQAEIDKALSKLRARHPGAFASPGNTSPAGAVRHGDVPPGTPLHQYTKEQLARLSDEDFNKIRKATRTSGLAV